ncbi:MAG: SWIM zinc finger family protein [Candidatus Heimdallarchaeota archaeon]|nr:SWIM zinc finger family protein [Candidatus Heimdallarchaeota archaeon]MBY8995676.1 SWIM zinc finger family protein [Candidatus Heimdallarchaeota archaeon]
MPIPDWIIDWIQKDRLVAGKYRISRKYLRNSKRIQFMEGERNKNTGNWSWFKYVVISQKYGKYWVRYTDGVYECSCPFFKHRKICSHILGVAELTDVWPNKESIFPSKN